MATTIATSFEKLRQNLEITDLQESTVSTRQKQVRAAVANRLTVLDDFLTGSYSRHTMIAPLNEADIDIFVVLSSQYFAQDGQANLLERVRKALLERYQKTPKISRNGQAVTITFSDFRVDVVPAFHRKGGGYLIADSRRGKWIATNPKTHVEVMSNANAAHNGSLVPLSKMVKAWNCSVGRPFESFYLELLVRKILTNVTINDYPSGMRYFLDKGRAGIRHTVSDPVPYGGQVQGLSVGTTVASAVEIFEKAHRGAVLAEAYAASGQTHSAVDEWREIFRDYFPSYG